MVVRTARQQWCLCAVHVHSGGYLTGTSPLSRAACGTGSDPGGTGEASPAPRSSPKITALTNAIFESRFVFCGGSFQLCPRPMASSVAQSGTIDTRAERARLREAQFVKLCCCGTRDTLSPSPCNANANANGLLGPPPFVVGLQYCTITAAVSRQPSHRSPVRCAGHVLVRSEPGTRGAQAQALDWLYLYLNLNQVTSILFRRTRRREPS